MPEIRVLGDEIIRERVHSGLLVPMESGPGLQIVDCGDERPLTLSHLWQRMKDFGPEISPGRYYGAVSGVALTGLIHISLEDRKQVTDHLETISPEGFVDFAAKLSDTGWNLEKRLKLVQHSADENEDNELGLANHNHCQNPLGCKFATFIGAILHQAGQAEVVQEARDIASTVGSKLPFDQAVDGIQALGELMPIDFSIHRGALHHARTKKNLKAPIAMHLGKHVPNETTRLVIDLAGYRSNANRAVEANMPRYHHTPSIPKLVLERVMPDTSFDPDILVATGILLAASTRRALSGKDTPDALGLEVIPPEMVIPRTA